MKPFKLLKPSSEWNKFRNKKTTINRVLFGVIALFAFTFIVGGISQSKHAKAETGTGIISMAAMFGMSRLRKLDLSDDKGKGGETELLEKVKQSAITGSQEFFKKEFENNSIIKEWQALTLELKEAKTIEAVNTIKSRIDEIGLALKALEEKGKPGNSEKKSIATAFVEAYKNAMSKGEILSEKKVATDDNKTVFKQGFLEIEVKSATTMTNSNVTPSVTNAIPYSLTEFEPGINSIARRNPFIVAICNVGRTIKKYIMWAEQKNPDGGAATTSEGSAKTEQDFDIVEASMPVEKITSYIKVSKEMLDDISYMEQEIRGSLMELIQLKLDAQVLNGNGTPPNLKGILQYAQTFAAGSFANAIDYANRYDVLAVAYNQIVIASGGDSNFAANFVPNYIVLHPTDATFLQVTKDQYGQYVLPPFSTNSGMIIKGCEVIISTGMTAGSFLIGDFTKANVRIREDAMIAVGYENDDFTKNLITILGELRACHYVKSNHVNAFVTGVFTTAIAALKDAKS